MSDQQNFDASGFDDDADGIAAEAKAEDAGTGRHPRGRFQGVIGDVVQKEYQGQPLWEVHVHTAEGTGKYTIFGWRPGEIAQAKAKAAGGQDQDLKRISAAMARHKRLFVDVGLAEPETWAKGDNSILGRLAELSGRPCTLVVQQDRQKPDRDRVFINAPASETYDDGQGGLADPTAGPGLDMPYMGDPGTDLPVY